MDLSFKVRPHGRRAGCARSAIILLMICVVILPVLSLYPFYSDIDVHHCIALELNRAKDLPYRVSFIANLPGIVGVHLLAIALFGSSVLAFRLTEIIFQAIIILALYGVSRFWISEVPAIIGCLVYALMYVHGPIFYVGHPDCFAILPMLVGIGSLILAFRSSSMFRRSLLLVVAGLAYGVATCFRPTFALLLFLPILFLFDLRTAVGWRSFSLAVIGFVIPIAACIVIYAPTVQGLRELYVAIVRYNVEVYVHSFHWRDCAKRSLIIPALIVCWRTLLLLRRRSGQPFTNGPRSLQEIRFLTATFVSLLIGIGVMGRLAGYHLIPFFALFLPVITAAVWEWSRSNRRRQLMFRLSLAGVIIFLYPWQLIGQIHPGRSVAPFSSAWYADSEASKVVAYVLEHTKQSDAVEVTFSPSVRWRIDRPVATRFDLPDCITLKTPAGSFTPCQQEWQIEYLGKIMDVRPKYYIVRKMVDPSGAYSTLDLMFAIPGFRTLLDSYYRLDTSISSYLIYIRKDFPISCLEASR